MVQGNQALGEKITSQDNAVGYSEWFPGQMMFYAGLALGYKPTTVFKTTKTYREKH